MAVRVETDFTFDANGSMRASNEPFAPARRAAPRAWLGWTATRFHLRVHADLPPAIAGRIAALVDAQSPSGARVDPALRAAIEEALQPATYDDGGPAFRFGTIAVPREPVVLLDEHNRELVRETYPWLYAEFAEWAPCLAVVREGTAVSVCFTARLGAEAAEAGVDTLATHRGHGHAVAVTAAWGLAIRAGGRIPMYSTSWSNVASQAVARRLGLISFGADASWA